MATKSIGLQVGRNYATVAAYASYANALALSAPEIAEVYTDTGAVPDTTAVTLSGWTGGSSTNTLTLRAAAGNSFRDHASVQTNALAYDPTKGAALTNSADGVNVYTFGADVIVDGLQIKTTAGSPGWLVRLGAGSIMRNCILNHTGGGYAINVDAANVTIENTVVHCRSTASGISVGGSANGLVITDCLFNSPAAGGGRGLQQSYATSPAPLVKNTAVYGFTNDFQGAGHASCTNNATSLSAFGGTNWGTAGQTSITSVEWVSLTGGSEDFRLDATNSVKLKNNGATAGPTNDIAGTTRPQYGSYDIGPWELKNNVAPVSQDFAAAWTNIASVQQDFAATYGIIVTVSQDFPASYTLQSATAVSQDFAAAYAINATISSDFAASYSVAGAVFQDFAAAYAIASPGLYTSDTWYNNTLSTPWAPGTAVSWTWTAGGITGSMTGKTIIENTGVLNGASKLVLTGLPAGAGELKGAVLGATRALDSVYLEYGTVV